MRIAQRVHEFSGLKAAHLRPIRVSNAYEAYVERHTKEDVGAALVHLARQLPSAT